MLEHGGRLLEAIRRYGIPREQWLDLSTGINPHPYIPPELPLSAWHRLPEPNDGLEAAATTCYDNAALLPLAGSQAAIQALPRWFAETLSTGNVACVGPLYNEHPAAWQTAGHRVAISASLDEALEIARIIVLCNPNNPDGRLLDRATLLDAAVRLATRGGFLIVDEAFIDPHMHCSVTTAAGLSHPNLIVLRSLGKFFGLAGARVGFLFAADEIRLGLAELLGPWAVSHPARVVATAALNDRAWQASAKTTLLESTARLEGMLATVGVSSGVALFRYLPCVHAVELHEYLAVRGILTRLFENSAALRFGLPGTEPEWNRLDTALKEWKTT